MINDNSLCSDVNCRMIVISMEVVFLSGRRHHTVLHSSKISVTTNFQSDLSVRRQAMSQFSLRTFFFPFLTLSFLLLLLLRRCRLPSFEQYDYCYEDVRPTNGIGIDVLSESEDHGVGMHYEFLTSISVSILLRMDLRENSYLLINKNISHRSIQNYFFLQIRSHLSSMR